MPGSFRPAGPLPHSDRIAGALATHAGASALAILRLKLGLAELVLEHAPPGGLAQLGLVRRLIEGEPVARELREARQDCWSYAGAMACGCTATDSAAAQAVLVCLEPEPASHDSTALREQVARVLSCGVPVDRVAQVLGA